MSTRNAAAQLVTHLVLLCPQLLMDNQQICGILRFTQLGEKVLIWKLEVIYGNRYKYIADKMFSVLRSSALKDRNPSVGFYSDSCSSVLFISRPLSLFISLSPSLSRNDCQRPKVRSKPEYPEIQVRKQFSSTLSYLARFVSHSQIESLLIEARKYMVGSEGLSFSITFSENRKISMKTLKWFKKIRC